MVFRGIDIGESNGTVNWDSIKETGINFAIIRIGFGSDQSNQDDSQADRNMDECKRLGIPYGVYSYALCEDQAHSEANHILRMIRNRNPKLGVWFDMEDADGYKVRNNFPPNQHVTELTNFCCIVCDTINNAGYKAGVYANLNYFNNILDSSRLSGYSKWLAHWYYDDIRANNTNSDDKVNEGLTMWQYSSWGQINGSSWRTDMNYLYGDLNAQQSSAPVIDIDTLDAMTISAYNDILKRNPDEVGLINYRNAMLNGMTETSMRDDLKSSDEAKGIMDAIIIKAYNDILHRSPDGSGLESYRNELISGKSEEEIRIALSNSDEGKEIKRNYIRELYNSELGRIAKDDEVEFWMQFSNDYIANGIHNSEEANTYRNILAQIESDKVAEANRLIEEQRIAEEQRVLLEKQQQQLALEEKQRQQALAEERLKLAQEEQLKIDKENARLAEIERIRTIKLAAQAELTEILSHLWTGFYLVAKDESTGLYTLFEAHVMNYQDDLNLSKQQELDRVAMKDAYDKYNGVILGLK